MRKILIMGLFLFLLTFNLNVLHASEYESFQSIEFKYDGASLLEHYTKDMYDKAYDKIDYRQFWGWSMYTKYKTEPVIYTKDTLYVILNEGTTPITETFVFKTVETQKKQYSVSGNISMNAKGDLYTIELGFVEKLDWEIINTTTESYTENIEIKVEVDPMTRLTVEICGEGKISNGVAKYYRFWRSVRKGGWEVFLVTTEYYSLRKEAIDE